MELMFLGCLQLAYSIIVCGRPSSSVNGDALSLFLLVLVADRCSCSLENIGEMV